RSWVPIAHSSCFNDAVPSEVTSGNQAKNVLLIHVSTGNPTRPWDDSRIDKKRDTGFRFGTYYLDSTAICKQCGADISRYKTAFTSNVRFSSWFNLLVTGEVKCLWSLIFE